MPYIIADPPDSHVYTHKTRLELKENRFNGEGCHYDAQHGLL